MPTTQVPQPQEQASSETLATTLVALYVLAERQLLTGATRILARTQPTLAGAQASLPRLRRLVRQVLGHLVAQTDPLAAQLVTAAITEGRRDASRAVGTVRASLRLPGDPFSGAGGSGGSGGGTAGKALVPSGDDFFDLSMPHGERSANAIRADITSELQDVRFRITRLPDDIYKMIAPHGAIYQALENGVTPAQAQAMAWRVFVSQGVNGFTDRSGRNWSLSAYVEMAVRTAAMRAYNASHLARMHALDVHYFTVGDSGHPCPLCFPWQGKVLSDGPMANPEMPVDATIAEATAAGLWHPNCKHTLLPVIPGVTVLPEPREWTEELADEYRLTQRQRHLELQVRKAKRELEYAADPKVRAEAAADVRDAQAKVRQFVNATGFSRQSRREQLHISDQKIKLPRGEGQPPRPPRPPKPPKPNAGDPSGPERKLIISDKVRSHVLHGDDRGGGHGHGANRPGKTEFPPDWSEDRIFAAVQRTVEQPDQVIPKGSRTDYVANIDGVRIRVWTKLTKRGRELITAYPETAGPE